MREDSKDRVKAHWERETCGTRYGRGDDREEYFDEIYRSRYERTPYLREFARFHEARGKRVLEIGVGAGCDFRSWVENAALVCGIDLTEAAIRLTAEHLAVKGLDAEEHELRTADAERLPFEDRTFDIVYSYGVFHHTPDTSAAVAEAHRVLKPGGELRAMVYHVPSWTGFMLWVRYGLLAGRPLVSQKQVVFEQLESPGTKAYTLEEAKALVALAGFHRVSVASRLCSGDFLNVRPSARYRGWPYRMIWRWWPRWLVARLGDRFGLNLLISATRR
ncbi:MAG: class I SAM-dependent methyltransferase [Acidobacteria bacterium]|nr:class I SAM-dependent methyltransferase [Acidobacteriota bacterium]